MALSIIIARLIWVWNTFTLFDGEMNNSVSATHTHMCTLHARRAREDFLVNEQDSWEAFSLYWKAERGNDVVASLFLQNAMWHTSAELSSPVVVVLSFQISTPLKLQIKHCPVVFLLFEDKSISKHISSIFCCLLIIYFLFFLFWNTRKRIDPLLWMCFRLRGYQLQGTFDPPCWTTSCPTSCGFPVF